MKKKYLFLFILFNTKVITALPKSVPSLEDFSLSENSVALEAIQMREIISEIAKNFDCPKDLANFYTVISLLKKEMTVSLNNSFKKNLLRDMLFLKDNNINTFWKVIDQENFEEEDKEIVKSVLDIKTKLNQNIFHEAIKAKNYNLIHFLMSHVDLCNKSLLTAVDYKGRTPFFLAIQYAAKLDSMVCHRIEKDRIQNPLLVCARRILGIPKEKINEIKMIEEIIEAMKKEYTRERKNFFTDEEIERFKKKYLNFIGPYFDSLSRMKILLAFGVNPNEKDCNGTPFLFKAEDADTVKALIFAGADPNMKNDEGETPLFNRCHYADVVKELISAGADIHAKDKNGRTILFFVPQGWFFIEQFIADGGDIHAKDKKGNTALFRAWDADVIKKLILAGANPNESNNIGDTPLFYVTTKAAAELLIEAKANPNAKNKNGLTPLSVARNQMVAEAIMAAGGNY